MTDAEFNLLEPYCRNNMRKLKAIVRAVLKRFNEPVSPADMDDCQFDIVESKFPLPTDFFRIF